MIWLSNSTLARLRDQLRARGQRPSVVLGNTAQMTPEEAQLAAITAEYGPLCEAMYLMMSADGAVSQDEREVLKGALRNLSSDEIRGVHIEAMLDEAQRCIKEEGREKRMHAVIEALDGDAARGEVAFVLAAAIAFADNAIADEENETLNAFAEGLRIDDARANALLDNVESDMKEKQ
jgi:uncharacterized tellurite resistance protein B-like protein